jgi:hypothetical protein
MLCSFCSTEGPSYGLDDRVIGVLFPTGTRDFYPLHSVQTGCGAHPASYPIGHFPGVNRPERETDHSPPCSSVVKTDWYIAYSTPPWVFMAWWVHKHRDNFTFTLILFYKFYIYYYILFIFPDDGGSRFFWNGGNYYQTTWRQIPEECNFDKMIDYNASRNSTERKK